MDVEGTQGGIVEGLTTHGNLRGEYVWKLNNFASLGDDKVYSGVFEIGGYPWQLMAFPRGNQEAHGSDMSVYLAVGEDCSDVTCDFVRFQETRKASFTMRLIRQRPKRTEEVEMGEGENDKNDENDENDGNDGNDGNDENDENDETARHEKGDTEMLAADGEDASGKEDENRKLQNAGARRNDGLDEQGNRWMSAEHTFQPNSNDWGFKTFVPLATLMDENEGFLVDGSIVIKVEVHVGTLESWTNADSRRLTGHVGIINQGMTCYMNSLLQTMYNINVLRKAVYALPTNEDEKPSESMPLALQSVFHMLQFTDSAVDTEDLTKSFGWDTADAYQQHDAQEFNRILCDRLEEVMKGTKVEGTINKLFQGHFQNYIECINIDFKSVRKEEFLDLQLVVKDRKNIYESFDEYCAEEVLDGDNQYEAEGHGKQDAKKGGKFESLPPVLNIQLRRFEFDFYKMAMVKLNDIHEFYGEIDLDVRDDEGNLKYFTSTADKTVSNKYKLLAVLVHSGNVHGGHYFAYIRPDGVNWLKFDDETVTRVSEREAIEDNWGVSTTPTRLRLANAYMLVYVRASEWDSIMCDVTEDDIARHVRVRLRAEEEAREQQRKEAAEANLFTRLSVVTDAEIKRQVESTLFMDLVELDDLDDSLTMKLPKTTTFGQIKQAMQEKTGIPVNQQRYWRISETQQGVTRPRTVLDAEDDVMLRSIPGMGSRQGHMSSLNVYLERWTIPVDGTTRSVFLKKFVPGGAGRPVLEYVKHVMIPAGMPFEGDLLRRLKVICAIDEGADCVLLEEVKSAPDVTMLDIDVGKSANDQKSPLVDGAILIVQQVGSIAEDEAFPTVTDFFTAVKDRVQVTFKPLRPSGGHAGSAPTVDEKENENQTNSEVSGEKTRSSSRRKASSKVAKTPADASPAAPVFTLEMMKSWPYDTVSEAVANHLGLDDPLKVQFTARSVYDKAPRPYPIKYRGDATLQDLCRSGIYTLFYEPIDVPIGEYERLVNVKVILHDAKHDEVTTVKVTVLKDKLVADLSDAIKKAVGRKVKASDVIRVMDVHQWKIWQVYDPQKPISEYNLDGSCPFGIRAEVVPASQLDLEQEGRMHVHCLQVEEKENKPNQAFPFSDPFIMDVSPTETVGELKLRVKEEMQISDEEFAEWKVVLVSRLLSMEPLEDEDVVSEKIPDTGPDVLYGTHDRSFIGFFHENKNPRRTHAHLHRGTYTGGSVATIKMNI